MVHIQGLSESHSEIGISNICLWKTILRPKHTEWKDQMFGLSCMTESEEESERQIELNVWTHNLAIFKAWLICEKVKQSHNKRDV